MQIRSLAKYLVGNRRAILDVAENRDSIWIGLLLVVSATLAREYDTHDLRSEPWRLLVPLGASLAMSALLYVIVQLLLLVRRAQRPWLLGGYRTFLGLFWMTAPLAWLYAVPYERMLSDLGATEAKLWTLAIVAAWRVMLISRVISVVIGAPFIGAFFLVMLVAGPTVLLAVSSLPTVIPGMAGIYLSPRDSTVFSTILMVQVLSQVTLILWLIAGPVAFFVIRAAWQVKADQPKHRPGWMPYFAAATILFWLPWISRTQQEQHLRFTVETDMTSGRIAQGLATMSAHTLGDFPPHWDPPPRSVYDDNELIIDVMNVILDHPPAAWVKQLYLSKLGQSLEGDQTLVRFEDPRFVNSSWPRIQQLLSRMSKETAFLAENKDWIDSLYAWSAQLHPDQPPTAPATAPAGLNTSKRN